MRNLAILFVSFCMVTMGCGDGNVFSSADNGTENSMGNGSTENGSTENGSTENGSAEGGTEISTENDSAEVPADNNAHKALSREEAEKVFDDTRTMLSRTIKQALKMRGSRALEFNFDFEVDCPDHGGIFAETSAEVSIFGESKMSLYGDVETCSEDGTNYISGWLELEGSLTLMPPSTSLAGHVEGNLAYEGEVEGECDFELTVEVGPLIHFDIHGLLCGFEF